MHTGCWIVLLITACENNACVLKRCWLTCNVDDTEVEAKCMCTLGKQRTGCSVLKYM
jgi:hypothetical protein